MNMLKLKDTQLKDTDAEEAPINEINHTLISESDQRQNINKNKSRRALLLMLTCFALPVIFAYLTLQTGWYQNLGMKNQGILVHPPVPLERLGFESPTQSPQAGQSQDTPARKPWRFVYILPSACGETCENRLIQLRQATIAAGPYKQRISTLIVQPNSTDKKITDWIQDSGLQVIKTSDAKYLNKIDSALHSHLANTGSGNDEESASLENFLFLADTQDQIILAYPPVQTQEDWISQGKAIIKDLKHLLKVSRIG